MRGWNIVVLGCLGAVFLPQAAAAGTARVEVEEVSGGMDEYFDEYSLRYEAEPGETNRVRITYEGALAADIDDLCARDDRLAVSDGLGRDRVQGGLGNELIVDGPGDDTLSGGGGDDAFRAGPGADTIRGGAGVDNACYGGRARSVRLDADGRADDGQAGERDRIGTDVEVLVGGEGDDRLTGTTRSEFLAGRGGDDLLVGGRRSEFFDGGAGNDRLIGGGGSDSLSGGPGRDLLETADTWSDQLLCGSEGDRAVADRSDSVRSCERIRRVGPYLPSLTERCCTLLTRGHLPVTLACPVASPKRCTGTLRIEVGGRIAGRGRFNVRPGGRVVVRIKLSRFARRRVRVADEVLAYVELVVRRGARRYRVNQGIYLFKGSSAAIRS